MSKPEKQITLEIRSSDDLILLWDYMDILDSPIEMLNDYLDNSHYLIHISDPIYIATSLEREELCIFHDTKVQVKFTGNIINYIPKGSDVPVGYYDTRSTEFSRFYSDEYLIEVEKTEENLKKLDEGYNKILIELKKQIASYISKERPVPEGILNKQKRYNLYYSAVKSFGISFPKGSHKMAFTQDHIEDREAKAQFEELEKEFPLEDRNKGKKISFLGYVCKYEKISFRPKQYAIAEGTIKNVELLFKSLK
jgi:hypothetical protein